MSMDELKKAAWSAIDRSATALQSLSSKIWSKPELAYEEHEAHALLTSFLKEHGFQVDEHYTLDTAFRARAGANEGANIAVICEFDALPEIGHACGHNLIAEAGNPDECNTV
jgi:metal-dependent amidase/aminoacylase/carboxypeptidase family protein